jgi:hypothetical protein
MIKLIDILKEINEAKQIGDIYHFTSTDALAEMIKNFNNLTLDILDGSEAAEGYYSFTRNPNLGTLSEEKHHIRIKLDGDKMSTKYKFEPYADVKSGEDFLKGGSYFEAEERINSKGKPLNLTPYIEEITILDPESFKDYLDTSWGGTNQYDDILKDYNFVLSWIKKNNIPLKTTKQRSTANIRISKNK